MSGSDIKSTHRGVAMTDVCKETKYMNECTVSAEKTRPPCFLKIFLLVVLTLK